MPHLAAYTEDDRAVERFLRDGAPVPQRGALDRLSLTAYAALRLPNGDPRRTSWRSAVRAASMLHLHHKATLVPLIRALDEAGIDALVVKGFYLAEFVYGHPAERPYGDVDVLVRPEAADATRRVARGLGWTELWSRSESLYRDVHEESVLERDGVLLELHRLAIDGAARRDAGQRRITAAVWARARRVAWEGTHVWVPEPVDAALTGLVLARAWSGGDDWHLKSSDLPDLRALAERAALTRNALVNRARELGVARTLDLILERCDPWLGRLELAPPSPTAKREWTRAVASERGHLGRERAWTSARRLPGTALDVLRNLPHVLHARSALRRGIEQAADAATARAATTADASAALATKEHVVRGVKWGAAALGAPDPCALRTLALARALGAHGIATRVWIGHDVAGRAHARIDVPGLLLRDLEDVHACPGVRWGACYPPARTDPDAVSDAAHGRTGGGSEHA